VVQKPETRKKISYEAIQRMKSEAHLSDNQVNSICKVCSIIYNTKEHIFNDLYFFLKKNIREDLGRHAIDPYMKKNIQLRNKTLDDLFSVRTVMFSTGERNLVYCTNLNAFTSKVVESRNIVRPFVRFNIDGGQNFLKMSMCVFEKETCDLQTAKSSSKFLNTGVKKIFIISLVQDVPESYEDVQKILSALDLSSFMFDHIFVCDMKINSILAGISANSSLHPCIYCTFHRGTKEVGQPRTFKSIEESYNEWIASGGKNDDLKTKFNNTKHPPLVHRGSDTRTLSVIAPSQLHIFIGVVNLLFDNLYKITPIAENWRIKLGIKKDPYFGQLFNGNACQALTKTTELLDDLCRTRKEKSVCKPFQKSLFHFGRLMSLVCRTSDLTEILCELKQFSDWFEKTNAPITNKVHVVREHLVEFYCLSPFNYSVVTEQSHESLHHEFEEMWKQVKVKDTSKNQY
jgi:hypothetical protein